ncbi:17666_t:CDS:2, partial [Cetraspora pellucida]
EKRDKERSKNKSLAQDVELIVAKTEKTDTEKVSENVSETSETATAQKNVSMVVHYDLSALISFASPLATEEFTLELMQVVRKASRKRHCRRGVKEVVKALKKGHKGLVVIAGDISPIDIITHIPILCEDFNVPYIYIPSRADLGFACATKRPTSVVMIVPDLKDEEAFDYKELYMACYEKVKELEQMT